MIYDGEFEPYLELPTLISSIYAVKDHVVVVDMEAVIWLFNAEKECVCSVEGTECWPSANSFSISGE